jgi:hypothetical protein
LIKCLCTTVGETFSDDLVNTWAGGGSPSVSAQNSSLLDLTFVTAGILAITLAIQFTRRQYIAPIYWLNVVLISVFGSCNGLQKASRTRLQARVSARKGSGRRKARWARAGESRPSATRRWRTYRCRAFAASWCRRGS